MTSSSAPRTAVDHLRGALLRELLHCVNYDIPVDRTWFEIADEQSTRSMATLKRREKYSAPEIAASKPDRKKARKTHSDEVEEVEMKQEKDVSDDDSKRLQVFHESYEMELTISTSKRFDQPIVISQMTAALLYERYDIFKDLFNQCRHKERRIINLAHRHSHYNLVHPMTLWGILDKHRIMEPLIIATSNARLGNLVSTLARIFSLIFSVPKLTTIHHSLVNQVFNRYAYEGGFAGIYFQLVVKTMALLHDVRDDHMASTLSAPDLCGPIYMPPVPFNWPTLFGADEISDVGRLFPNLGDDVLNILINRIYDNLITRRDQEPLRWMHSHMPRLLAYMDHLIAPFMRSLVKKQRRPPRPPIELTRGYAFRMDRRQCSYEFVDDFCFVRFAVNDKPRQFILRRSEYDRYQGTYWLCILHGAHTTEQTHPWIRQHTTKYHHQVTRLRFGLNLSDGLILPWDSIGPFMPELYAEMAPNKFAEVDLTGRFNLCKTRKDKRSLALPQRGIPFVTSCVLNRQQLIRFAPTFARFSAEQRHLFYAVFWNVGPAIMPSRSNNILNRNIVSMVEEAMDWTLMSVDEVRDLLPRQDVSAAGIAEMASMQEIRNYTLRNFWNRIRPLGEQLSPRIQAFMIMQDVQSPILICMTMASMQGQQLASFFSETLHLIHKLGMVMTPLSVLPDNNTMAIRSLIRLVLSPGVPCEIRRTAWHSLTNIPNTSILSPAHPLFPQRIYPIIPDAQLTTLPRTRVQFQHILVPEWMRVLTIGRDDGLGTHPNQFQIDTSTFWHGSNFSLQFDGEEGRGPSVQNEVLMHIWKCALQERVVVPYDEDGTVWLASEINSRHTRRVFELGFISALALLKGYYLPYPLHIGWWRFLYPVTETDTETQTMHEFFPERTEHHKRAIQAMSEETRQATFESMGISSEFMTHEELVEACFLPKLETMLMFKQGWDMFMRRIYMATIVHNLNSMFVEPSGNSISLERFIETFMIHHILQDLVFLEAIRKIPADWLARLVQFITGKSRLPILDLSEDKITVCWNNHTSTMPIAQNCTNTLLMPVMSEPITPDKIIAVLRPVFEFETVFGFA